MAPQALWLMNNRTAWNQAEHLAARVLRDGCDQPDRFVPKLWKITLGRQPTEQELAEAIELIEQLAATPGGNSGKAFETGPQELRSIPAPRAAALVTLCLAMFNHNEFLFID